MCRAFSFQARTPVSYTHLDVYKRQAFRTEALWGADFLVRMCDPAGMFYMTVFDRWSGDTAQREICSYSTQKGHKHDLSIIHL